jgi:hypothetical protein
LSKIYTGIRRVPEPERTSERLLALRSGSLKDLGAQRDDHSLMLATWNLRDFDSNKFGWGPRLDESLYYIAEMIACFDLVAIQEVNQDLRPFERLLAILGARDWDYLLTDVTEGTSGNGERMAFVFRRDKVWFRHIAGEVVLPDGQLIVAPTKVSPRGTASPENVQASGQRNHFARSPYLVAFQSGWFKFSLCTVHIYYGKETGPALERRINEIQALVDFFAKRQDAEAKRVQRLAPSGGTSDQRAGEGLENYILLGDFNVVSPEHRTMQALQSKGFTVPEQIGAAAIKGRDHFYDQIAVRVKDPRFRVTTGGILPIFEDVFRDGDEALCREHVPAQDSEGDESFRADTPAARYKKWRTWQVSDHSPLWIKIETDFTDSYLEGFSGPG